jgi:hypothetical protein
MECDDDPAPVGGLSVGKCGRPNPATPRTRSSSATNACAGRREHQHAFENSRPKREWTAANQSVVLTRPHPPSRQEPRGGRSSSGRVRVSHSSLSSRNWGASATSSLVAAREIMNVSRSISLTAQTWTAYLRFRPKSPPRPVSTRMHVRPMFTPRTRPISSPLRSTTSKPVRVLLNSRNLDPGSPLALVDSVT